jgi:hypothetical protein
MGKLINKFLINPYFALFLSALTSYLYFTYVPSETGILSNVPEKEIQKTTELEERIQYYKGYAAMTRITYPKLSELASQTAEDLEELQRRRQGELVEVKND